MSMTKQLYQLQEVDLELEAREQAIKHITSQLGESEMLVDTRQKLADEQQRLKELEGQQRSLEWEIEDLTGKLTTAEKELYSGRIRNPKELANLQHETEGWQTKRGQLEDKALAIMEQVELVRKKLATLSSQLRTVEAEWQSQQQKLAADLEQLQIVANQLRDKRQLLAAEIGSQVIALYGELKKQKGAAVAKVEQGMCRGCRISLPITELQQVRSGHLVRCSSCGRILYLA